MHHLHGPPQLDGKHINKARGPVSCSTDMAIVNHMKGTSIHLRHSSLSQSRQKFNSHICQLLWHSCEITPTCAHEAVQQLKDTSACIKNKTERKGKGQVRTDRHCHKSYVYVCSSVWWSMNDHRHMQTHNADTLALLRQQYITPQAWRQGQALLLPSRSRPPSLPATYQH